MKEGLEVRLLGRPIVVRDGAPVALPRSRKVITLLALLALDGVPHSRSRLCDLLWDLPNDPRAELRWCLSKLRAVVDQPPRRRIVTKGNTLVALDLAGVCFDCAEVQGERVNATTEQLAQWARRFRGDLLEGCDVDGGAELASWLAAGRQRFRALRLAIVEELARRPGPPEEMARRVDEWLQLAPFDERAHEWKLTTLLEAARLRDADEHVAGAIRRFEQEGIDWSALRSWWLAARIGRRSRIEIHDDEPAPSRARPQRASVAVMPFVDDAHAGPLANGLTDDIITRLAKLRALFVIARGTSYALGERGVDPQEAGRILAVDYVASGRVRRHGTRIAVLVEVSETRTARIVWTDELTGEGEGTFAVLDGIVDRIVAAIAEEIESEECHRALLKPPSSLDAWEAYHRGLWHMYRFTGPDNRDAQRFFHEALRLDPTFARAHAGMSFTHFQNVFLDLTPDRDAQMVLAYASAAASVATDERDPAAHWAMGRALWLRGAKDESAAELQRSIELSPNFALGHYTLGFVEAQSGDPRVAIASCNTSRALSPFDPLQFGMLASRALAHVRLGEREEAVQWARKAIARPNAHAHIMAIAISTLALTDRRDEARKLVARVRERLPTYDVETLLRAFRFDGDTEALVRSSARSIGFDGGAR